MAGARRRCRGERLSEGSAAPRSVPLVFCPAPAAASPARLLLSLSLPRLQQRRAGRTLRRVSGSPGTVPPALPGRRGASRPLRSRTGQSASAVRGECGSRARSRPLWGPAVPPPARRCRRARAAEITACVTRPRAAPAAPPSRRPRRGGTAPTRPGVGPRLPQRAGLSPFPAPGALCARLRARRGLWWQRLDALRVRPAPCGARGAAGGRSGAPRAGKGGDTSLLAFVAFPSSFLP